MSVRAFCREENICAHTLYIWRKRFSSRRPVRFAVVEVRPERLQPGAGLELVLCSGERLQIPSGVDGATLRVVLAAVRERA